MSLTSKICRVGLLALATYFLNLQRVSAQSPASNFKITPSMQVALDSISAASLTGHLSFIASDILAGRDSPSPGLDIAAEYIAAQFRRAGLEPLGDNGYFQTAEWLLSKPEMTGFSLIADIDGRTLKAGADEVTFRYNLGASLSATEIIKIAYEKSSLSQAQRSDFLGKAVITEIPDFRRQEEARWRELFEEQQSFLKKLRELGVVLILSVDRGAPQVRGPIRGTSSARANNRLDRGEGGS